jgi:hypothetical protein
VYEFVGASVMGVQLGVQTTFCEEIGPSLRKCLLHNQQATLLSRRVFTAKDKNQKRKVDPVGRCMHDLFSLDLAGRSDSAKAMYQSAQQQVQISIAGEKLQQLRINAPPDSIPVISVVIGLGLGSRWFYQGMSWASLYPFIAVLHQSRGRTPSPSKTVVSVLLRRKRSAPTRVQRPLCSVGETGPQRNAKAEPTVLCPDIVV